MHPLFFYFFLSTILVKSLYWNYHVAYCKLFTIIIEIVSGEEKCKKALTYMVNLIRIYHTLRTQTQ